MKNTATIKQGRKCHHSFLTLRHNTETKTNLLSVLI